MMRTLKVAAVGAALVLAQACGMSAAVLDQRAEGTFDRTLTVSGKVDLDVTTGSGRIEVRTGQTDRVEVHGRITVSEWSLRSGKLSPEERVKRLQANPPIEQTGNRIRIGRITDDDLRNVSVSYTLVVPAQTALVSTTGSGSQEISGLRERIEAGTGSGSIRLRDASSDVRATTGSGSIEADGVGGAFQASTGSGRIEVIKTGKGDVDVSTGSGSIEVRGVHGGLRASTGSGSLRIQGEQTTEWRLSSSSGSITIELAGKPAFNLDASSSSGSIDTAFPVTVSGKVSKRELRGPVNGGGPLLHLRTSSGGIRIR
jgi:DUF4097 and DUF4098 domain-containing protein YvlB